jgi:UDP-N-acetylmuramate dehydrogenase
MNFDNRIDPTDLARLHTFGLPATARSIRIIQSSADLQNYISQSMSGKSVVLLGEGSNTVFVNQVIDAEVWLMRMRGRQYLGVRDECHIFRLAAGENWHSWVEWSVFSGYPGLENLALIPGSVGASPIQNIGAYGVELKDRIKAVHGFDTQTGEMVSLSLSECRFGYRESIFKHELKNRFVITEVDFALPVQWSAMLDYADLSDRCCALGAITPANVMESVIRTRTERLPDPEVLGNSGSFFKNPLVLHTKVQTLKEKWPGMPVYGVDDKVSKLAAGWLIEQCGLKGLKIGGVQVYPRQALILTNLGAAKGADLLAMIEHIKSSVKDKFGVELEPEPNLL